MVGVIIGIMPLGMLFLYWAHRRRVHPIVVWLILSILTFCGSRLFHENRTPDQRLQLAVFAPIVCAVATWVLFRFASLKKPQINAPQMTLIRTDKSSSLPLSPLCTPWQRFICSVTETATPTPPPPSRAPASSAARIPWSWRGSPAFGAAIERGAEVVAAGGAVANLAMTPTVHAAENPDD
jgi:hypothetical protein